MADQVTDKKTDEETQSDLEPDKKRTLSEVLSDSTAGEMVAETFDNTIEKLAETREQILESLGKTIAEVKPALRGWFHLAVIPIAVIAGLTLLVFTPTTEARGSIAIFVFASLLLFSVSATYHRTNGWLSARTTQLLQKTDHASISFLIAGTNTPFAVLLLDGPKQWILLFTVWAATFFAIVSKYAVPHPPRWLNVPIYIGLGWVPIFFIDELYYGAIDLGYEVGMWTFCLIVAGGLLYSIGGILFAWRPKWLELKKDVFGYHEVFHLFTVLAFSCHYIAISLIAYSLS